MRHTRSKIAIMGGTFNPVHNGHIYIAELALRGLNADMVLFIPDGDPPHKTLDISGAARLDMVRLAVEGRPDFAVTDIEIVRAGHTYTWQTIDELTRDRPYAEFTYIVGEDTLFEIQNWRYPERVLKLCGVAAVMRPAASADGNAPQHMLQAKRELERRYNARVELLDGCGPNISSTEIRAMVARGEDVSGLTPASVGEYILRNGLYSCGKAR